MARTTRSITNSDDNDDPTGTWMHEVTLGIEEHNGRISLVEKAMETMAGEVRRATEVANIAAKALERIARAEEERGITEKERNQILREQGTSREKWAERVWSSSPFQLLLTGVVMSVLQLLGTAYMVSRFPGVGGGAAAP